MTPKTVWAVYFSGTGTTERTVRSVAGELARMLSGPCRSFDFTRPQARQKELSFCERDLVVFGTPVYAGRVPNVLLPYLREKVRGGGALAVPVVLLRHDTVAAMPFLAMMAPVGLIVPSVMLPTTYKLGATKGRVVYIVMLMVVAATCAVLMTSESVRGVLTVLPILPVIIITLAIFVGSWALSVKWFKAREL